MQKLNYSGIYVDAICKNHKAKAKERIAYAQSNNLKLYKVYADYCPNNEPRYPCYIFAKTKRAAKQRFSQLISWLNIYSVDECSEGEAARVISKFKEKLDYIFI